jgi:PAS domain S-box-containing protein
VRVFLRDARDNAKRTSERIQEFADRLRRFTDRSASLARRAPSAPLAAADLVSELRERDLELADVNAELRRQSEQLAQARQFLERERARYADLFDSAPDAYIESDAQGVVREANLAAAALLALPPELLVGKLLISFVARGDTRAFRGYLAALGAPEPPEATRTFEVRLRPRGGSPFLASVSVRAVRGAGAHRWTLRPLVAHAASEGHLLDLVALAVHELRAPLAASLGWLQMLRERAVPESERDNVLVAISESARAQGRLIDDLAEITQARTGRGANARGITALTEIVSRAAEGVRPEAIRRKVVMRVEQVGGEPLLEIDEAQSTRSIARLLLCVVRSAPPGTEVLARIAHRGDEATLEVFAPGVRSLGESPLALAAMTECFSADGARFVVPAEAKGTLLCSARWTMRVPAWRREPPLSKCAPLPVDDVAELAD